jgi:hypothetical protein
MWIPKRYWLGIFWGILTALALMALSYMAHDLAHLPFLPVVFFRLPEGSILPQMVLFQAAILSALVGTVFSLVIVEVAQSAPRRAILAGIAGSVVLFLLTILAIILAGLSQSLDTTFLIWLAILLGGWGWVLTKLIGELDQSISAQNEVRTEIQSRRMTPRQFRYLVIAGSLTAIFSALRILWIRSGN